jgi:glycosyltransferase involved in cell wall biosynthesis
MNNNIIFVETTDGFPKKFTANNSKVDLLAKGLMDAGDKVCIINTLQGSDFVKDKFIKGTQGEVNYYTFSKYNTRHWGLVRNFINQCKILTNLRDKDRKNIIIMGQPFFLIFIIETICYKLMGYKIGITKTEWPSKIQSIKGFRKIDFWLSDKLFGYFVHYIFPISTCIENLCLKFRKPMFRIPILASFPPSKGSEATSKYYFLICSTLAYKENVKLVIDAFCMFYERNHNAEYSLKLILSGSDADMVAVRQYIKHCGYSKCIHIFNQIPYNQLTELYQNATGLLIPLQDTFQDRARFSQKIAEYLSTGNPIITNCIGDIRYYFKDEENAFIAKSYSAEAYAEIMGKIAQYPNLSKKVGQKGYLTGKANFDNITVCKQLSLYLENS